MNVASLSHKMEMFIKALMTKMSKDEWIKFIGEKNIDIFTLTKEEYIQNENKSFSINITNSRMVMDVLIKNDHIDIHYNVFYRTGKGWSNPIAPDFQTNDLSIAINQYAFSYLLIEHIRNDLKEI